MEKRRKPVQKNMKIHRKRRNLMEKMKRTHEKGIVFLCEAGGRVALWWSAAGGRWRDGLCHVAGGRWAGGIPSCLLKGACRPRPTSWPLALANTLASANKLALANKLAMSEKLAGTVGSEATQQAKG